MGLDLGTSGTSEVDAHESPTLVSFAQATAFTLNLMPIKIQLDHVLRLAD